MKMSIHIKTWVALCCMCWMAAPSFGELRTWTSAEGVEVRARYIGADADLVLLETEEGAKLSIRQQELSAPDRAWAQKRQAADEAAKSGAPRLPVLRGGPGHGRYAFYQHARFDAYVCDLGRLYVQPKQDGLPLGEPIVFASVVLLQQTGAQFVSRTVNGYRNVSPPALNPRTLSFVATTDTAENVPFKVEYTFADNTISVVTEIVHPRKPALPSKVRAHTQFPASYRIENTMTMDAIKRAVAGATLTYQRKGAAPIVHNFYDSLQLAASVDQVIIKGPWGPLTVYLEGDNRRDGNLTRLYNYSGKPLYDGYALFRQVDAGARTGPYTIRIE